MISVVNYKIKKDKLDNKRKVLVIGVGVLIIIAVILAVVLTIIFWPEDSEKPNDVVISTPIVSTNVNGKLANYIRNLGEEYYIKYSGQFGKSNFNTALVDANIEFTKKGENSAIYSNELNIHVLVKGEDTYNILHKQKLLLKSKLPLRFSTEPYNLISDFGQIYVNEKEVKIDGVKYVYQEYTYEQSIIRYYFVGDNLSHIRIILDGNERKINIRVDKKVNEELFKLPEIYKTYDI